ncbi:MAG: flippase-like domain-containing protein, partial [Verrucomicrobia bacterium]|nr:flippase-like domain-containing protein [Verrucomicrobiota bacterium]
MKRKTLYVGLSLLVTIGVFSFIFTHVSLREVLDLILNCNRFALGIFIVLSLLMSLLRMWRYRLVLNTSGYHPSSTALYLVVLVRNLFSDLLPARIGSLVYIYIITNRLGIPFAPATSSFTLSLLFDIIAIAPMILVASLFCAADIGIPPWILTAGAAVIGAISLAALMAITPTLRTTIRLITASRRSQQGFGKKLLAALSSFQIELERAREAGI